MDVTEASVYLGMNECELRLLSEAPYISDLYGSFSSAKDLVGSTHIITSGAKRVMACFIHCKRGGVYRRIDNVLCIFDYLRLPDIDELTESDLSSLESLGANDAEDTE